MSGIKENPITENPNAPDNETIARIEKAFSDRITNFGIKRNNKKYYELQCEFFVGAMAALNTTVPIWSICIMSGRDILDERSKLKN